MIMTVGIGHRLPTLQVTVAAPPCDQLYRPTRTVDAIVDTGFSGDLALPPEIIAELWLDSIGTFPSTLANGSVMRTRWYRACVSVGLIERMCVVTELPTALLGTGFLDDLKVTIQNSKVHIDGAFVDLNRRVS